MSDLGFDRRHRVVVAVSGGADSVALLASLKAVGYDCLGAHCNFHLRGAESDRDMRFVEDLARRLGCELAVRDFDVPSRMASTGESIEMACRSLRYDWFHSLMESRDAEVIAVGHHREDNVETFMLNLLRGSGINGLAAIKPRNGSVVRPLLDFSRTEIENYLGRKGLSFVVDSTNLQNDFKRNRLRNELLPRMETLFPGAMESILSAISNLRASAGFYGRAALRAIEPYLGNGGAVLLRKLIEEDCEDAEIILYEYMRHYGFNMTQTRDALRAAAGSGKMVCSPTHTMRIDRGVGSISDNKSLMDEYVGNSGVIVDLSRDIETPLRIKVALEDINNFKPRRDDKTIYLDSSALDNSPHWAIRPVEAGDRLRPFGLKGSKLVSDLFNDAKYTAGQKRRTMVLTRDGVIIWVIGLRASSHFKVTPATKHYLKLELQDDTPAH